MNLLGTKLACQTCGAQVVVIKGGDGEVVCHGQALKVVAGAMDSASQERRQQSSQSAKPNDPPADPY